MNSLPMKNQQMKDDNDRLLEGTLPQDPFADAKPLDLVAPEPAEGTTADDPDWPDPLPIGPVARKIAAGKPRLRRMGAACVARLRVPSSNVSVAARSGRVPASSRSRASLRGRTRYTRRTYSSWRRNAAAPRTCQHGGVSAVGSTP